MAFIIFATYTQQVIILFGTKLIRGAPILSLMVSTLLSIKLDTFKKMKNILYASKYKLFNDKDNIITIIIIVIPSKNAVIYMALSWRDEDYLTS